MPQNSSNLPNRRPQPRTQTRSPHSKPKNKRSRVKWKKSLSPLLTLSLKLKEFREKKMPRQPLQLVQMLLL